MTERDVRARGALEKASAGIAIVGLCGALCAAFVGVDGWAAASFAQRILGSSLVAVIDVALFLVALLVAPLLSRAVLAGLSLVLGRGRRT
jgi:hypothetical protein